MSQSVSPFEVLPTDVVILVLSFLSVMDNPSISVSRRLYYLLSEFQRLRPQLVTSTELFQADGKSLPRVFAKAAKCLRGRPNVAFAFYRSGHVPVASWAAAVQEQLPADTVLVAASSPKIQTNLDGEISSDKSISVMLGAFPEAKCVPFSVKTSSLTSKRPIDSIREQLNAACPNAPHKFWKCFVVYVCGQGYAAAETTIKELQNLHPEAVIIGGICQSGDVRKVARSRRSNGDGGGEQKESKETSVDVDQEADLDKLIQSMTVRQLKKEIADTFGPAALVGITEKEELCAKAKMSLRKAREEKFWGEKMATAANLSGVESIHDGIVGMAMGGNVPLRSVVSRGVCSCYSPTLETPSISGGCRSQDHSIAIEPPPTVWSVDRAILASPGDEDYPYEVRNGEESMHKPVWVISKVQKKFVSGIQILETDELAETQGGESIQYRGAREFLIEPLNGGRRVDYIGVRKTGEDGFTLHQLHQGMLTPGGIVIDAGDRGANQQYQSIIGAAIDAFSLNGPSCVRDLDVTLTQLHRQLDGEQLLGALMFSCGGRGPSASMMGEAMCDATHFDSAFPGLPCLGFYAGGEIGPMALHGNANVFQSGRVALQGFTAVFGVFVVPIPKETSRFTVDDSPEQVTSGVKRHLQTRFGEDQEQDIRSQKKTRAN